MTDMTAGDHRLLEVYPVLRLRSPAGQINLIITSADVADGSLLKQMVDETDISRAHIPGHQRAAWIRYMHVWTAGTVKENS